MYIFYGVAQMLAKCSFNLLQLLLHGAAQGGTRRHEEAARNGNGLNFLMSQRRIPSSWPGPELVRLLKASYSYEQNFLTTAQIVRYTQQLLMTS